MSVLVLHKKAQWDDKYDAKTCAKARGALECRLVCDCGVLRRSEMSYCSAAQPKVM